MSNPVQNIVSTLKSLLSKGITVYPAPSVSSFTLPPERELGDAFTLPPAVAVEVADDLAQLLTDHQALTGHRHATGYRAWSALHMALSDQHHRSAYEGLMPPYLDTHVTPTDKES